MSIHEERRDLLKCYRTVLTGSKGPEMICLFSSDAECDSSDFPFVKMATFVTCRHAVNTSEPRRLECMLYVQNTNLAIVLS